MTGIDVARFTHKSVPVIFEPPCTIKYTTDNNSAEESVKKQTSVKY